MPRPRRSFLADFKAQVVNVRSRSDVARKNEVLCKFLCHDICCVIMSQVELGIEANFWKDGSTPTINMLPSRA